MPTSFARALSLPATLPSLCAARTTLLHYSARGSCSTLLPLRLLRMSLVVSGHVQWQCWGGGRGAAPARCTSLHSLSLPYTLLPPTSSAVQLLSSVYKVIAAACEKEPPTTARLTSFYGKVVVCLHEAFSGQGYQLQRNLETILRNAKLKAPL